jgi:putative restriction endonuclease
MRLNTAHDLFLLGKGETVSKRAMYDLVQYSKVPDSPHWAGREGVIGNTPQQGINWIGPSPVHRGIVVKTKPGVYGDDGWSDAHERAYKYSFKAVRGVVNYGERANRVLIQQPRYQYPVLLFIHVPQGWQFVGAFRVSEIQEAYVSLSPMASSSTLVREQYEDAMYPEGGRSYVTHLMAERSAAVVRDLKSSLTWICEICNQDFESRYGVRYIEAHHKVPMSTFSTEYLVSVTDLAMLCPNCHKAVHLYMKKGAVDFEAIKSVIRLKIS